ncbi:MAG: WD40 repeat domain-containing protein, partial [Prevotellaceae bacterium]|nr:WD40 repeat domain-containing protein [Prevotellaceae bacterium]
MIKINKIENDSKNILVNDAVMPAVFVATAIGDLVRIVSTQRLVPGVSSHGIHYSLIEINDEACESANDAVQKLNAFIGSFKSGGGGISPEVLKGYVKEVPNPEIVGSEIVETNIKAGYYEAMGIASNGKTYFCGRSNNGIKVLDDDTGIIEDTNITSSFYKAMGIASNDRTYFCGGAGIKVLNDDTGIIEDTNITSGYYEAMGIASDDRTYFCGSSSNGIKVLDDDTGIIEETNITTGNYKAIGTASNGKTYFCSNDSNGGIKVLNKDTGIIEYTNIVLGFYVAIGTASNGKTYFCGGSIRVLNDETEEIEYTNVTDVSFCAMGIASNGKTYFCGSGRGIMVLQPVYADEKYVRRYGEWLPALGADAFNNDFTTDVDFVISEDGDTVVAEQFYKNPATGETKQIDKVIPLADATHAGLMSKEQAQGATDSANAINNLDNKDVAIYEGGEYKYVTL